MVYFPLSDSILLTSVTVLHSLATTGWSLKCLCPLECQAASSEVCVGTCNMAHKSNDNSRQRSGFFSLRREPSKKW